MEMNQAVSSKGHEPGNPAMDTPRQRMLRYLLALGCEQDQAEKKIDEVEARTQAGSALTQEGLAQSMRQLQQLIERDKTHRPGFPVKMNAKYSFQQQRCPGSRSWSMPESRRIVMTPTDFEPRVIKRVKGWFNPMRTWI
ncbi:MAG: hypothetical protein ACWA44_12035 [Thiotrichales bacterium]